MKTRAYYNDNDPFVAAVASKPDRRCRPPARWERSLTRSIEDVQASDRCRVYNQVPLVRRNRRLELRPPARRMARRPTRLDSPPAPAPRFSTAQDRKLKCPGCRVGTLCGATVLARFARTAATHGLPSAGTYGRTVWRPHGCRPRQDGREQVAPLLHSTGSTVSSILGNPPLRFCGADLPASGVRSPQIRSTSLVDGQLPMFSDVRPSRLKMERTRKRLKAEQ